jgi:hypothetical protein
MELRVKAVMMWGGNVGSENGIPCDTDPTSYLIHIRN